MADAPKHPTTNIPQGGMVVPTQQGPQVHTKEQTSKKLSEASLAEQKAGRDAVQRAKEQLQQEQEQGKKIIQEG